jgi:DNA polymerase-3 subunit gamma/tau
LLATTDPQKLPVTVLSRCLQFNLKRLPVSLIAQRMKFILDAENLGYEAPGIRLLAEAADGSMRDGLSLLDQLLAFGGGRATEAAARAMLATVDRKQVEQLLKLIGSGDAQAVLAFARSLEEWAPDYADMLDEIASLLVQVAMKQALPAYEGDELHPESLLAELAAAISPEDVQLHYQTVILGRRDLAWAPDPRSGFEMTLLRILAFRPMSGEGGRGVASAGGGAGVSSGVSSGSSRAAARSVTSGSVALAQPAARGELGSWPETLAALELGGAARQLAAHCALIGREGGLVRLALDPAQSLLKTAALVDKLSQALAKHLGENVKVEIELAQSTVETPARAEQREVEATLSSARQAIDEDPTVRGFKERFGATIKTDSVKPN